MKLTLGLIFAFLLIYSFAPSIAQKLDQQVSKPTIEDTQP